MPRYYANIDREIAARAQSGHTFRTGFGTDGANETHLGWTPGTDVASELAELFAVLGDGDRVEVEGRYQLTGSGYGEGRAVSRVSFVGTSPDAGFQCLDGLREVASHHGTTHDSAPVILVRGDGWLFQNLVFTQVDDQFATAIDGSGNTYYTELGKSGNSKSGMIRAEDVDGFYLDGCTFDLRFWTHVKLLRVANAGIIRSTFKYPKYSLSVEGHSPNLRYVLCEGIEGVRGVNTNGSSSQIHGDFLKTSAEPGTRDCITRPVFAHNTFRDCVRDAIDTTGGFDGAMVCDNRFLDIETGAFDIKSIYASDADVGLGLVRNRNVLIAGNLFRNTQVVLTTNWGASTSPDIDLAPQGFDIDNNVFLNDSNRRPAVLVKTAKDVRMHGNRHDGAGLFGFSDHIGSYLSHSLSATAVRQVTNGYSGDVVQVASGYTVEWADLTISSGDGLVLDVRGGNDISVNGKVTFENPASKNDHVVAMRGGRDMRFDLDVSRRAGTKVPVACRVTGGASPIDVRITGTFANVKVIQVDGSATAAGNNINIEDAAITDGTGFFFKSGHGTDGCYVQNVTLAGSAMLRGGNGALPANTNLT